MGGYEIRNGQGVLIARLRVKGVKYLVLDTCFYSPIMYFEPD